MTPDPDLLLLLDSDPRKAAEKYELLFARLTRFFEWRGCTDPEALASETLVRGFTNVKRGKQIVTPNPAAYFFGIAKNILFEVRRAPTHESPAVLERTTERAWRGLSPVELAICLRQCLARLSPDDRSLFEHYNDEETRAALAERLHLSPVALRVRVHRIRQRLLAMLRLELHNDEETKR